MSYIQKHWRGDLSLPIAFWANLVALSIGLTTIEVLLSNAVSSVVVLARILFILFATRYLLIYPWQLVGVWRACRRHAQSTRKTLWSRAAQTIVLLGLITSVVNLALMWPMHQSLFVVGFIRDPWADYTLSVRENDTLLHFKGRMGRGAADDVAHALNTRLGVRGIILDSPGGWVEESRRIARLIQDYELDTYSLQGCASACTVAFIAGKYRKLGLGANLGFHQYSLPHQPPGMVKELWEQLWEELLLEMQEGMRRGQEEDRRLFAEQVDPDFAAKAFSTPAEDVWCPTQTELLAAGVVDEIIDPLDILPLGLDQADQDALVCPRESLESDSGRHD